MTAPYESDGRRRSNDGNAGGTGDPEAIRAGINQTRERISHDLDEIGQRLNPERMKTQIKDGVREATIGKVEQMAREAGDGFMGTIRDNPLPAAMAGIGLAWLFMNRRGGGSSQGYRSSGNQGSNYYGEASRSGYSDRGYTAESYRYETEQSRFTEVADSVKEKAQQAVSSASEVGGTTARKVEDTFFQNPLAIAAAAIAAGLAVGLAAPETTAEKSLIGEAGSQIREKVAEVARETTDKVSTVAQRAVEETKNAAREEGLTGNTAGQQTTI